MLSPHLLNILIHVGAGSVALLLGAVLLLLAKGTRLHVAIGRVFVGFASVVCVSALVGTVFFRFIPLFAVLTLLVSYLVASGWQVVCRQALGPGWIDALLTLCAAAGATSLLPVLLRADLGQGSSPPVIFSTLGALAAVVVYDCAKWFFPLAWHARVWRFEHIYKLLSALFGMLSAAVGNVFHTTLAQLLPSVLGVLVIAWFFWREHRRSHVR